MKYKIVGRIKYKNNKYLILMNKKLDKYYVGINNNEELIPLELKTYLELQKHIFNSKQLYYSGIKVGDTIDINPIVKIKKRLVPLALATSIMLSLNGCGNTQKDTINELSKNGIEVTKAEDNKNLYYINSIHTDLIKDNNTLNISKEYFGNMYYDKTYLPKEINQYLNYGNITWNDIIEAIKNNKSINEDLEKILIQGINNIETKEYNYDLTTLYYNLKNIKIEYCEDDELPKIWGGEFNSYECSIKIKKSQMKTKRFKHILFHEIIGHGSQEACINLNGEKILFTNSSTYLTIDKNGVITDIGKLGVAFNESFADVISSSLQNKKIDCNIEAGYPGIDYYCNTIINSCDGNYSNYVNDGTEYLTEILENINYDPYEYINYADYELTATKQNNNNFIPYNGEYSNESFIHIINKFISNTIDNKLKKGLSKDEVYQYIKEILKKNDNLIEYYNIYNNDFLITYTSHGEPEQINKNDILSIAKEYIYGKSKKKSK